MSKVIKILKQLFNILRFIKDLGGNTLYGNKNKVKVFRTNYKLIMYYEQ